MGKRYKTEEIVMKLRKIKFSINMDIYEDQPHLGT